MKKEMRAYKKQHYLPAAYLKYFSIDQKTCTRQSFVWRFDGKEQRKVPVESQCFEDYHYSKSKPAAAEKSFQRGEEAYCRAIDRIRAGEELKGATRGDLLLFAFDLYLRNAVHQNMTSREGIEAYNMRATLFLSNIIGAKEGQDSTEVAEIIKENWFIKEYSLPKGHYLLTSDHPSDWVSLNQNKAELHLVSLPVTPQCVAIAFDKRVVEIISDQMTTQDCLLANLGQSFNANRCIYTHNELTLADLSKLRKSWSHRSNLTSSVTEKGWLTSLRGLRPEGYFSFIRRK